MHRPRRTTKGAHQGHKKGYKLKLSPQQAHLRTKKAWVTRRRKYGHLFGIHASRQTEGFDPDYADVDSSAEVTTPLTARMKRARQSQDPEIASEIRTALAGSHTTFGPTGKAVGTTESEGHTKDQLFGLAEQIRSGERLEDEGTRRAIGGLTEAEKAVIVQRLAVMDKAEREAKTALYVDSSGKHLDPYTKEDSIAVSYLNTTSHFINPDPKSRRADPSDIRIPVRASIHSTGATSDATRTRKITRQQILREQARALYVEDPLYRQATKDSSGGVHKGGPDKDGDTVIKRGAELPSDRRKEISLVPRSWIEHQTDLILLSHAATTPAERDAYAEKARHMGRQIAQTAQKNYERRAKVAEGVDIWNRLDETIDQRKTSVERAAGETIAPGVKRDKKGTEFDGSMIERRRKHVREQRLGGVENPLTFEDAHKKHFEKGIGKQAKYMGEQKKREAKSIIDGTGTFAYNSKGDRTTEDDAAYGITPNLAWRYELNHKPKTNEAGRPVRVDRELRFLDFNDTKTRFHRPKRHAITGEMKEGEWDQLHSEELVKKFHSPLNTKLGVRDLAETDKAPLPVGIDEQHYIPVRGITEPTSKIRRIRIGEDKAKTVKIIYMPEDSIPLKKGQSDTLYFGSGKRNAFVRLPDSDGVGTDLFPSAKSFGHQTVIQPFIAQEREKERQGAVMRAWQKDKRAGAHNVDVWKFDKQYKSDEAFKKKVDEKGHDHVRDLISAGGAAAVYGFQTRATKNVGKKSGNRAIRFIRKNKQIDKTWDRFNVGEFNVKEARRPAGELVSNWKFAIRHPLSSPEGTTLGVDWGFLRDRKRFIEDDARDATAIKRDRLRLERTGRTRKWFHENAYSFRAKYLKDNLLRDKDYHNYDSHLNTALNKAFGTLEEEGTSSYIITAAHHGAAENLLKSTSLNKIERESLRMIHSVQAQQKLESIRGGTVLEGKWAHVDTRGVHTNLLPALTGGKSKRFGRDGNFTTSEGVLVGGAVIATAVGAHYLYHRHQEKKLKEADPSYQGTHYLNKVLPKPFKTPPAPKFRSTGHVRIVRNPLTEELRLADRKVPVRWGASLERRHIKLRPEDRGYEADAPLVGGLKVRGEKGGSVKDSVVFRTEDPGKRRRQQQRGTHEIVVKGKKLPIYVDIGKREKINLTASNPNRITDKEREQIVWAFAGTQQEREVRKFYSSDDRLQKMFSDVRSVEEIRGRQGTTANLAFAKEHQRLRREHQYSTKEPIHLHATEAGAEAAYQRRKTRVKADNETAWKRRVEAWENQGAHVKTELNEVETLRGIHGTDPAEDHISMIFHRTRKR